MPEMAGVYQYVSWTLTTGERVAEIETDGRVGSEAIAHALARVMFDADAYLSFRASHYGTLTFTFTDRQSGRW